MTDPDTNASEIEEETSVSLRIPRFNGSRTDDYGLWRMRLRAACRVKGVWDAVEESPGDAASSSSTSKAKSGSSKSMKKREKASGIIISGLGDAALRVVMEADEDPSRMLQLLDGRYASSRTVSRIAVQTQLFRMSYNGQNMSDYIDQYTSLFSQLERMGKDAAIPESHKAPMLLASINPSCSLESTAAALRTKESSELTWDYVATTLIDEYKARQVTESFGGSNSRNKKKKQRKYKRQNAHSSAGNQNDDSDDESDIDRTINAFAAALKSSKSGNKSERPKCSFCGRLGHHAESCFVNPDNPKNRLPKTLIDSFNASKNSSTSTSKTEQSKNAIEFAGCVTDRTTITPPDDLQTYADSGATIHIFHSPSAFVPGSLKRCSPRIVALADKNEVQADVWGEVIIPMQDCIIRLQHVLFVKTIRYNLVSTGKLADNGIESLFRRKDILLKLETDGTVIGCGFRASNGMYVLPSPKSDRALASIESIRDSTRLWHRRLAHLNMKDLVEVHKYADGIPKLSTVNEVCRACRMGKAHKLPFHGHFQKSENVGDIIHSDVVGPLSLSFPDRFRYVCTFMDDHSRYTFLAFLRHRSEVGEAFRTFKTKMDKMKIISNRLSSSERLSILHSDGAKEYKRLENELGGKEIESSFSPPYTPELNGIAERVNRTMVEGARTCLIQAGLPDCLWPFALKHVMNVRNRVPHSAIKDTPFNVFHGTRPNLKQFRVFGCTAYILHLPQPSKFEARAREGVYLESMPHGIYKMLIQNAENQYKIVESRNVTFNESVFLGVSDLKNIMDDEDASDNDESNLSDSDMISLSSNEAEIDDDDDDDDSDDHIGDDDDDDKDESQEDESDSFDISDIPDTSASDEATRYPRRVRRKPPWYMATTAQTPSGFNITTCDEPTMKEAMQATLEEREMWIKAIEDELISLDDKETWIIDEDPKCQPLPTHIVLKIKRKSDGSVERFKARIVAGGNLQILGLNYFETYAPVVSFTTVRIFLQIALHQKMHRAQLDVKTAFLNGIVTEDIWIMSPRGIPGRPSRCYKLLKAIYGLKQAHLAWHTRLVSDLNKLGFVKILSDTCVFKRTSNSGGVIFLLVYVDDILVLASSKNLIETLVRDINTFYEVRVNYNVDWFLGVKIDWNQKTNTLGISQPLYVRNVLKRFGMQKAKPAITPMTESFWTSIKSESKKTVVNEQLYQQIIGSLMYLAQRTRFDIMAPVMILSRFQKAPTAYCHQAAKRILRYLCGTLSHGIL